MLRFVGILLIAGLFLTTAKAQPNIHQQTMQSLLSQERLPLVDGQDSVRLFHKEMLKQFYRQRNYQLAWQADNLSDQLLSAIDQAINDGLDPSYAGYHKTLISRLAYPLSLEERVLQDLLLSDAFITLGYHLFHGVAFGTEMDTLHRAVPMKKINMQQVLSEALQTGQIAKTLTELAPKHAYYLNLKTALRRYLAIAEQGGWNEDPEAYQDYDEVKQRLSITGEFNCKPADINLIPPPTQPEIEPIEWVWGKTEVSEKAPDVNKSETENDAELEAMTYAVMEFQQRHHISVDGAIGPQTRQKMAESVQSAIDKIRLNLERWRWYNSIVSDNYVMVNIPNFSLQYVNDTQALSMKVVVGQKKRPTPIMEAKMSYLVFNPYWRIPKTILAEDILPKLRKNKNYLNSKQISLFNSSDSTESHPLDSTSIDWQNTTKKGMLRYTFRQEPGVQNPLGRIKFMFPNSEDIYIHDTSARYLFKNKAYLVSSGCVRAEQPMELAYEVLNHEQPEFTRQYLDQQIQNGDRQVVHLQEKIPVYLTYQTAWADKNGRLDLRNDVYGIDDNLMTFMKNTLKMYSN